MRKSVISVRRPTGRKHLARQPGGWASAAASPSRVTGDTGKPTQLRADLDDAGLEAALLREIWEEIAGEAVGLRPFHEFKNDKGETEHFFIAQISEWNFDGRTGPEFERDDRGEYQLHEVPLTVEAVDAMNLMPPQVKEALLDAIREGHLASPAA